MNQNPILTILKSLFGTFAWSAPNWYQHHRKKAFFSLVLLALLTYAGIWYKNRPHPAYVTASIAVPATTANTEPLVPNNLVIDFGINNNGFVSQSVAPINSVGNLITEGITMKPAIAGDWSWSTDSQLVFTPKEDWPADQKFTISFTKDFFAPNSNIGRYDYSFTTHPFTANINEFKLYQDPVNPDQRYAVATIAFNYPVNPESLEKNTELWFQTKNNKPSEQLKFTYSYDVNKRIAYLHSAPIEIKTNARFLDISLDKSIKSSTNSGSLIQKLSKNLFIPDATNFMKVVTATASIVRNSQDRPEQVLNIETTLGVKDEVFNKHIQVYLLPKDYPASKTQAAKENYNWTNPGDVTKAILALATPLTKETIPSPYNYASLHSYKFNTPAPGYLFVQIDKGMSGLGNFSLATDYQAIIPVPELPKEIGFLHKGSLLALSGEKKLSVLVRGLPAVRFDFARVLPENINQLVTQTQGNFNNPYFINPTFNQQNISQIFTDIQEFDHSDLTKQQYTALDIGKYLNSSTNTLGPKGLFIIQARGWDLQTKTPLDVNAARLVLITDLGILVKDNKDGSHDVYVQSITQGKPVANVAVAVLGKNGLPLLTHSTDAQGHVSFPSLKDYTEDKEPTVYLASLANDVSFIPFANANRQLNYSKFDIGGLYTSSSVGNNLSAYVFSDRGIYRPGDTVHLGMIVKQAYASAQPAGLPLQLIITDARGVTVKDEKISLNDIGFLEADFTTTASSPTGQYQASVYLVKDNQPQNLLGSTTVKISEFQPDRMRISASLFPKPDEGWSAPQGMKAEISLWNLYGAPAANRKISGRILLTPQQLDFTDYPGYVFADPLLDPKKPPKVYTEDLADTTTNEQGKAEFNLHLERFEQATYELTFFAEGFEAEGGRSVTTQIKSLVSPIPYFIGYKPDGDLAFIKQNAERSIHYLAINPQLNPEPVKDLKIQLVSLQPVTSLVKKPDGTFQYQSIIKSTIVSTDAITIDNKGYTYTVPTKEIGDYSLTILGKDNTILSQLKFSVVGASQKPLAKNAELSIKLNKTEYNANEPIEIQLTAPYTGSGLITIERDHVYASSWFKTDTTSSLQTITIPADFQGNGYINVAFIRDWDSPELFISPLSYAVVPFSVTHEAHAVTITLHTETVARPGEELKIEYQTSQAGKIIVYAVDDGILQVAHYETPDPLEYFFQKYALEVQTQQTVDQILPKFIQDRELSAIGGDEGEAGLAGRLNPFKRKTQAPVVFWSGIIDADTTQHALTYKIPDYFNGLLKVMAVAVATEAVGANESSVEVRGDFIINPNIPTFVSPKDEFAVSASIANNVKNSGDHASVAVELTVANGLEIVGNNKQYIEIAEGKEQSVQFTLRAKENLGSADVTFKTALNNKTSSINTSLSIRPAMPMKSNINSGILNQPSATLPLLQNVYPQLHTAHAIMSANPLIFIYGLQRYLQNYPYGCTEQLVSKGMPLLAMNAQSYMQQDKEKIHQRLNQTLNMLSQRQMSSGGFAYWPTVGDNQNNSFDSVYAMQFLTEARAQGIAVSDELFYKGIGYLKDLASQNPHDLDSARIQAYAIYILTRNEIVTSNYIANVQQYLQTDKDNAWKKDITAVYLAASYQILKNFDDANALVNQYEPQSKPSFNSDFYNANTVDAQYLYILAKHFPDLLAKKGDSIMTRLVAAMNNDELNTVLSGFTAMALSAYQQNLAPSTANAFSITEVIDSNHSQTIKSDDKDYLNLSLSADVQKIIFNNDSKQHYFYQLIQSGFDKQLPTQPLRQGLEIYREYRDEHNSVVTQTTQGAELSVHIHVRALNNTDLSNVAIEDLLPGGFEVVSESIKKNFLDYADIREDRVLFFGPINGQTQEIVYKIKATNKGQYTVPPIYAEAMYDPTVKALGIGGQMIVK